MSIEIISRFQPCYILYDSSIPCVLWCEDAVGYYGVPTVVFDLHILVPEIDKAAKVLTQRGYHHEDIVQSKFGNASLRSAHYRLTPPMDGNQKKSPWSPEMGPPPPPGKARLGPPTTLLLPASEWGVTFPSIIQSFFPPLPQLLDALIDKLLDDPVIWHHVAVLLGYLYGYVSAVKEKSFAAHLKYEHGNTITTLCQECQRAHYHSFVMNGKSAMHCKRARIRASMGLPVELEDYEVVKQRELEYERLCFD